MLSILLITLIPITWCVAAYVFRWDLVEAIIWTIIIAVLTAFVVADFFYGSAFYLMFGG